MRRNINTIALLGLYSLFTLQEYKPKAMPTILNAAGSFLVIEEF